jgi:tetratricopeptide (TPR) repeat protein/tRNA A-37 threonylcarbamoyl transferase component Bud32
MAAERTWTGEETIAATLADRSEELPDEARPVRLGRYLLLQRLGAGGMGVVYAAYDEKLDRKVAIKLLRSFGSSHAQLRLVREAQALARLSHPNVVQIYEIAEVVGAAGEQAYLVMEFVDGLTLGRWLADRSRSQAEILTVFMAAGRGLAAAHAAGLVHRDFKPDNVMIRSDGRVLVMDFGLAYADAAAVTERGEPVPDSEVDVSKLTEHLTATGAMMGTPAYMAPEQFLGLGTDPQTDQFGFCVTLWEALHGSRPFAGRNVATISMAVTEGRISRPQRDEVPTWLREVIERGLARDPAERWPSMQALLEALANDPTRRRRIALFGGAAVAVVIAGLVAVQVSERREQAELVALCEAEGQAIASDWNDEIRARLEHEFVATELELAASAWQTTRGWMDAHVEEWSRLRTQVCLDARVERTLGEDAYQRAVDCFDEHRATLTALVGAWLPVDRSTLTRAPVAAVMLPSPTACMDETALARKLRPPDETREQVRALRIRLEQARAYDHIHKLASAIERTEAVLADIDQLGWQPLSVEGHVELGSLKNKAGDVDDAVAILQQAALDGVACGHDLATLDAVTSLTTIVGDGQAKYEEGLMWGELGKRLITRLELHGTLAEADLLDNLADVQVAAGRMDDALAGDRRALAIREEVLGPDHMLVAASLDNIATLLGDKGEYDEALHIYERTLELRKHALGPEHFDVSLTINGIGGIYMALGEDDEALRHFEQASRLIERAMGPDHLELAPSCNNMGVIHWKRGNYAEALAAFRRAQTILEHALGPEHPRVAATLDNIGNVLTGEGSYQQAEAMHRRTLAIREATLPADHVDIAASLNNLATVLVELGRDDEALPAFERAQEIWTASLGAEHPYVATVTTNIADVHVRRGEHARGLELHQRALASLEAALGPDHVYVAYPLVGSGRAQLGLGELEPARVAFERALAIRERTSVPAAELAEVRFELAKLDWQAGKSRESLELARAARDGFVAAGKAGARKLTEIEAWLRERE